MSRVLSPERIKGNKLKFKVLKRDGYMCRICGSDENLEVHHMLALTFGGKSTMKNMITLCKDCHLYAPEDGIETNIEYLRNKNRIIYEYLVTMPESFALIAVAITEYLKEEINDYVKEWFITEEQKEKILDYQLNKIISRM
ncbi:MAG: HNH endonuclease [Bacillota bacterium]|nr:HNH endonuclease [Bacillota bacterium]